MKTHEKTIDGVRFLYWYDRADGGNWWASERDARDNQVEEALFAYGRADILWAMNTRANERNATTGPTR